MRIYPAIDIRGGNCVRLLQGDYARETVYGSSPAEIAKKWEAAGADFIHVVDLDGARSGGNENRSAVAEICRSVNVPVQQGGGIRTLEDVEAVLALGVSRVIIGTAAIDDPDMVREAARRHGSAIAVGIDAKDGYVATDGWTKVSEKTAVELALEMKAMGVETIIFTDIATDGTLAGPNVRAMAEMAEKTGLNVIASGGVGCEADLEALSRTGVEGAIVGKALYTGKIELSNVVNKYR
ncbi:MAG: 1-(5-phosphoribosyl)-5-[(5-phosphoribosylamino)methylideneamino]imidazole-4-carboxamide isomerase [Oscillospiraceae bacterium]|nr:1-(5-phosphoribosyl)-5-[(5-phosphoribosylamino)methylideneamino]imidazole-4-carboxamide isomerase [Oscillospiraceae bacterium]